jgi:superfamily II DNA/RNA helicase
MDGRIVSVVGCLYGKHKSTASMAGFKLSVVLHPALHNKVHSEASSPSTAGLCCCAALQVLVICPTQELCMQVLRAARSLVPKFSNRVQPLVGEHEGLLYISRDKRQRVYV